MFKFLFQLLIQYKGILFFIIVIIGLISWMFLYTDTNSEVYRVSKGLKGNSSGATFIVGLVAFFVFIVIGIINTGTSKSKKYLPKFNKKRKRR